VTWLCEHVPVLDMILVFLFICVNVAFVGIPVLVQCKFMYVIKGWEELTCL
jgi:hypothetical protein